MNKINNEPISFLLVILSNVKEDSTEQFNTLGYPIFSRKWINFTKYVSNLNEC